jgi:hypothetical protein
MAKKTRARRTVRSKASVIEKSLRDAQKVLSSYMESGGKQVKDTLGSLVRIFENQHLSEALAAGSRRLSRAVGGRAAVKRRTSASDRSRLAAPTPAAKATGNPATAKTRSAAARANVAKRTGRTRRK